MSAAFDLFNVFNIGTVALILLCAILFGMGLYWVLTDFLPVTSPKARKAVLALKSTKTGIEEMLVVALANHLVKLVKIDSSRRDSLQKKLYSAQIHYTPEFYTAKALSAGILVALLAIPAYFVTPLISLACIVLGIAVYFRDFEQLNNIISEKSEKINGELVQFASTIKQQLATSRDVMKILRSYRNICGKEFLHELDMTIADMKTGNYETALRNLETRVPSAGLSEIIHGLLAVMRGDDQRSYFEMLAYDLSVKEKERLKRIALSRPAKLKPAIVLLIVAFMAMYMYVICYQVALQLGNLF